MCEFTGTVTANINAHDLYKFNPGKTLVREKADTKTNTLPRRMIFVND